MRGRNCHSSRRSRWRAGYSETGQPGSEGGHAEKDLVKQVPRCVADPTQTLRRELLDDVAVWPDLDTAQAAIDAFRELQHRPAAPVAGHGVSGRPVPSR